MERAVDFKASHVVHVLSRIISPPWIGVFGIRFDLSKKCSAARGMAPEEDFLLGAIDHPSRSHLSSIDRHAICLVREGVYGVLGSSGGT